jgi:hypothetical protein
MDRTNMPTECACCGREGLKRTVKLVSPDGVTTWMGTTCAARAMGIDGPTFRNLAKDADNVVATAEAAERKARQDAEHAAWKAWLDEHAGPGDTADQIRTLGGFAAAMAQYREA